MRFRHVDSIGDAQEGLDTRAVGCGVERGPTHAISIGDGLVERHEHEFMARKCGGDATRIGSIEDAVRDHDDLATASLRREFECSLPNIY